jgi:pimeloyl-ACP methyl ester carboxylesterase
VSGTVGSTSRARAGRPAAPGCTLAEAGAGSPVLLLYGWPQHWWCWHRVIDEFRGQYRLLVPDLRGFGWGEAPGSGYTAAPFAHDVVALLDALRVERAYVVGHDWGGFTGILLGLWSRSASAGCCCAICRPRRRR